MTPTVLVNNDEAIQETTRRYDTIDMQPEDWPGKGWSSSSLQYRDKSAPAQAPMDTPTEQQNNTESMEDLFNKMSDQ